MIESRLGMATELLGRCTAGRAAGRPSLRSEMKLQPEKWARGNVSGTSWCGSDKEHHPGLKTAENQCSPSLEAGA